MRAGHQRLLRRDAEETPFGGEVGFAGGRFWSFCRFDLGLSDADTDAITWPQHQALIDRWDEEQQRQDFRFGVLAAALYNIAYPKNGHRFTPSDFFPSLRRPDDAVEQAGIEEEQKIAFLRMMGCPEEKIDRMRERIMQANAGSDSRSG